MELREYIYAVLVIFFVYFIYRINPVALYILRERKNFFRYLYVILPVAYLLGLVISLIFDGEDAYFPMLIPALAPLGVHFHITKGLTTQVAQENKLATESAR